MSRKYEAIDLMKLYTLGSHKGWNEYLQRCFDTRNINALAKLRYQICAGMDDLAKAKLNTEDINIWFIRLNRSIENTAKKIIRAKHPMATDSGLGTTGKRDDAKKRRDLELRKFLQESGY